MSNGLHLDIPAGVPWIDFTREFDAPVAAVFDAHRDPEKVKLVEVAKKVANGRAKVITGGGSNETAHAIELYKASEKAGADGVMIGRIALPERCANLCFGGVQRNRLFMAASQSIYALYVNTQGAVGG